MERNKDCEGAKQKDKAGRSAGGGKDKQTKKRKQTQTHHNTKQTSSSELFNVQRSLAWRQTDCGFLHTKQNKTKQASKGGRGRRVVWSGRVRGRKRLLFVGEVAGVYQFHF